MKKICMVAYTNYLSDARPRREAETLARRGDQVDFIALGEKDRPSFETVQGVRRLSRQAAALSWRRRAELWLRLLEILVCGHDQAACVSSGKNATTSSTCIPCLTCSCWWALIPKLFGARIVLNIHDMMPELYMSKFGISEKHPLIRLPGLSRTVQHPARGQSDLRSRSAPGCALQARRAQTRSPCCPMFPIQWFFATTVRAPAWRPSGSSITEPSPGAWDWTWRVSAFVKAADSCPGARFEIFGDGDAGERLEDADSGFRLRRQNPFQQEDVSR